MPALPATAWYVHFICVSCLRSQCANTKHVKKLKYRGAQAIELVLAQTQPLHVLLSDIGMPGMRGNLLAERLVDLLRKSYYVYL